MPATRTQSARAGCAVLLSIVLVGSAVLAIWYRTMTICHTERPPLTRLSMTIAPGLDRQFVEQSRQFAFKHDLRFDTDYDKQGGDTHIRMIGDEVEIIAKSPVSPGQYEVGFYNYDCIHPNAAADIVAVVDDFKSFMNQIPNVTIIEK